MSMTRFRLTAFLTLSLASLAAAPAAAQPTFDEWLALRTRKQARHHRLPATVTHRDSLTVAAIRFFSDSSGRLVGVGEARNHTGAPLTYARLNFTFFNRTGAELGRGWTYVHGGTNMRVVDTSAFETVLAPGDVGFFKIWMQVPVSAMASYTVATAGEGLAIARPRGAGLVHADQWSPLRLVGQRVSALVVNSDPFGMGCLCGHPKVFASRIQLSVAVYQGGVIADVQSVIVRGRSQSASCSTEPWATGLLYDESAPVEIDLAQPADSIARHAIEWDEGLPLLAASPSIMVFDELGGKQTFTTNRWCGPSPVASVPWITAAGAAGSDGHGRVEVNVPANPGTTRRDGTITLPGLTVLVWQATACPALPSTTVHLPAGRVDARIVGDAPFDCSISRSPQSNVAWLRPFQSSEKLGVSAEQNLTGATRTGVVTWARQSFTVHQSPAARSLDFNGDGRLDLLWRHRTGGWIAAWLLNGLRRSAGMLLSWNRVEDQNWRPAVIADLDRNGHADIVWQHTDGTLALWRLIGTDVFRNDELQRHQSPQWQLRGASDFNGDGDPDYVWQHAGTGEVQIWYMRAGTVAFSPFDQWSPPFSLLWAPLGPGVVADLAWSIAGTADFNRDGSPDVVWQHETDGRVAIWTMNGAQLVEGKVIAPERSPDPAWKVRAVGDIDGDDMPDLIWQHRADGRVAAWLMNGTELRYGVVIDQVADTEWEIVGPR